MPRSRRAVSRLPLFSMRLRSSRISTGVMSATGRLESAAAKSSSSHMFLDIVEGAAPSLASRSMYSAATTRNVFARDLIVLALLCRVYSPGKCRRASSRLARA